MFKEIRETHLIILVLFLILTPLFSVMQQFLFLKNETTVTIYQWIAKISGGLLLPTLVFNGILIFVFILILFIYFGGLRLKDLSIRIDHIKYSIIGTVLFWCLINILVGIISLITDRAVAFNMDWYSQGTLVVFGLLLGQLFGNALYEEVAFRGFLFPQFYLKLGKHTKLLNRQRIVISLLVSQVYFALIHIPYRLVQDTTWSDVGIGLLVTFVLGILFAILFIKTNNLLLVVGLHALFNKPTLLIESPIDTQIVSGVLLIAFILFWSQIHKEYLKLVHTNKA